MSDIAISIHALVKRATIAFLIFSYSDLHFNPRPREEGDILYRVQNDPRYDFNPRPREEGDYINRRCKAIHKNFNPRPREEGDGNADRG